MNSHYDNYLDLHCITQIKDQHDGYYAFEDTVFYGEKGGQEADNGWINGLEVLDLRWEGNQLWHKVVGELQDPIEMQVDGDMRVKHTQIQSALHLLDGFYERYGMTLISVSAKSDRQWYELDSKEVTPELLAETEIFMRQIIRQEIETEYSYMAGADFPDPFYQQFEELRLVKFGDVNMQPCGTPHVNHTGQIGTFAILGTESTKKGTKVHIAVGDVLADQAQYLSQELSEVSRLLNTNAEDRLIKLDGLVQAHKDDQKKIKELKEALMTYKAQDIATESQSVVTYQTDNASDLQVLGQALAKILEDDKAILSVIDVVTYLIVVSPQGQARDLFNLVRQEFPALKGGGSPQIVTGRIGKEDKTALELHLHTIFKEDIV